MNHSPVEVISEIDISVLFIHGKSDKSVSYTAAEVLYATKQGEKIFLVEKAGHAESMQTNPTQY